MTENSVHVYNFSGCSLFVTPLDDLPDVSTPDHVTGLSCGQQSHRLGSQYNSAASSPTFCVWGQPTVISMLPLSYSCGVTSLPSHIAHVTTGITIDNTPPADLAAAVIADDRPQVNFLPSTPSPVTSSARPSASNQDSGLGESVLPSSDLNCAQKSALYAHFRSNPYIRGSRRSHRLADEIGVNHKDVVVCGAGMDTLNGCQRNAYETKYYFVMIYINISL